MYGPWAAPVSVVRNAAGKLRVVCDYREINKETKVDAHPLPDLETILQSMARMRYFSCVDLCSGYHQVALDSDAIERSAVSTHMGMFE